MEEPKVTKRAPARRTKSPTSKTAASQDRQAEMKGDVGAPYAAPPPDELAGIRERLSEFSLHALGLADGMHKAGGSSEIHMEDLLTGLYATTDGPARELIGRTLSTERDFRAFLARTVHRRIPDRGEFGPTTFAELPPMSPHVRAALIAARATADRMGSQPIQTGHLLAGALGVQDCTPIKELRTLGISEGLAEAWEQARLERDRVATETATGQPAPETVPLTVEASAKTDQPTAHDLLGYTGLVDALADLLTGSSTTFPLTIGISAPWGGGKSSIMRLLDRRLREQPSTASWVIVYFPAWRYETGEQLWAAMAKATYDAALRSQPNWVGRLRFRWDLEWKRGGLWRYALRLGAPVAAAIVGLLLGNQLGSATGAPAGAVATLGGFGGFLATAQALWGAISDPFKRAVEGFANNPGVEAGDGFTPAAAGQVDALMNLLLERGNSVAIFIDDLDRCTPRNLVRVIEAVNQIFVAGADVAAPPIGVDPGAGQPTETETKPRRLVFVMGMDRKVVARGIEAEYQDIKKLLDEERDPAGRDYGLAFLDKIIQLWVTLPTPSPAGLEVLLRTVAGFPSETGPDNTAVISELRNRMEAAARELPPGDRSAMVDAARRIREEAGETSRVAATWAGESFLANYTAGTAAESPAVWAAMQEGAKHLEPNPRQLKRFNNAFRLQLSLAARSFDVTFSPDQLGALARWVAIRLRWAELAHDMDDDEYLLPALDRLANPEMPVVTELVPKLDAAQQRAPEWFAEDKFPELPAVLGALKAERPEQYVSQLPFQSFVRAA